jgi:hypothetical protein
MDRRQICEELDRRTVATTLPSMQRCKIHEWIEAWDDPKLRHAIQQMFSKMPTRRKSVKTSPVSG